MTREKRTSRSTRSIQRDTLVAVGLTVFIAVDILLVALALGWGRGEAKVENSVEPSQVAESVEDARDTRREEEPTPDASVPQNAPRLMSVTSDTVAWRSGGGTCDERGSLELTVDGGETWGAAYPSTDGLGHPLWLSGSDHLAVQSAVASGPDCQPEGVRTFDSGASWTQEDQVIDNSVFVDPIDQSQVIWGGEPIQGPCLEVVQVAVTGGLASVVCADGSLWSIPTDGAEWRESAIDGAVALTGFQGTWIAAVKSADCDGFSLVEFNEASSELPACAPAETGADIALDLNGNALWFWAGEQLSVSTDLGRSFN